MAESQRPREALEITPAACCDVYLCTIITLSLLVLFSIGLSALDPQKSCYMEIFVNSVSVTNVSNANVPAADWRIGFVARSPLTGCKITLRLPIKSRLLQGDQVIIPKWSSYSSDFYLGDQTNVAFETTVMPGVVNGGVIWDFRVEIVTEVKKTYYNRRDGFLMVICDNIPVKFTVDQAGIMMGSLLGFMRRCHYTSLDNLDFLGS